jgi:hypothetical protein
MNQTNVLPLGPSGSRNPEDVDLFDNDEGGRRSRGARGAQPPISSYQSLEEAASRIVDVAGRTGKVERLALILKHSPTSSVLAKKKSAFSRLGFFKFKDDGFEATELLLAIARPLREGQAERSRFEAFLNDRMTRRIWEHYVGRVLPEPKLFSNYIESVGSPTEGRNDWYEYFVEGGVYAGVLVENGLGRYQVLSEPHVDAGDSPLKEDVTPADEPLDAGESRKPEAVSINSAPAPAEDHTPHHPFPRRLAPHRAEVSVNGEWGVQFIPHLSNDKHAIICIPTDLSEQDVVRLRKILKSAMAALEGLVKEGVEAPADASEQPRSKEAI